MNSWQPIETAPKDGTRILAIWSHDSDWGELVKDGDFHRITYWECPKYYGFGTPYWQHMGGPLDEATPTHWMPLPKPPSIESEKAEQRNVI